MSPTFHEHPDPLVTIAPHLTNLLPTTLPLLRRLQFHAQSTHARVLASIPVNHTPSATEIWTACFVDRSRAPETESWVFNSLELPTHSTPSEADISEARSQLLALFARIRSLPIPDVFTEQAPGQSTDTLIVGAVHEATVAVLKGLSIDQLRESSLKSAPAVVSGSAAADAHSASDSGSGTDGKRAVVKGSSIPWLKFLYHIDLSTPCPSARTQEVLSKHNLKFSTVQHSEFELVRSRTSIPRRDRTLALLPSAGIRTVDGRLIAWAFLGPDASLSSLHVEEEFRGLGLGKAVAEKVLRSLGLGIVDGKGFIGLEDEIARGKVLAYSHTATDNAGSIGVSRALGGEKAWLGYWLTIDLRAC